MQIVRNVASCPQALFCEYLNVASFPTQTLLAVLGAVTGQHIPPACRVPFRVS